MGSIVFGFSQNILPHAGNKGIEECAVHTIVEVGGCLVAVAQWQSFGGSSQRCPRFNSRWLPTFSLSSIFVS